MTNEDPSVTNTMMNLYNIEAIEANGYKAARNSSLKSGKNAIIRCLKTNKTGKAIEWS